MADLSPDKYEFGFKKPDIFVPGTDMLISKKCYEMYTSVFDYLQAYKGDDVDAYIALMRVKNLKDMTKLNITFLSQIINLTYKLDRVLIL